MIIVDMGVDHRVDRGTSPPLFEVVGRNVFCPPTFWGNKFIMCKFTIFLLLILREMDISLRGWRSPEFLWARESGKFDLRTQLVL